MPGAKKYQHFCPVAGSLDVVGEKWSLLVVRDLLHGPRRFSDLAQSLGGITPKWLTQRLRDLESVGVVQRNSKPGRREVWYQLTPAGRDLGPAIAALAVWGMDHAMRPPRPDDLIFGDLVLEFVSAYLNAKRHAPAAPATWLFRFEDRGDYAMIFTGRTWIVRAGGSLTDAADVSVTTSSKELVDAVMAPVAQRKRKLNALRAEGSPAAMSEMVEMLSRVRASGAQPVAG